MFSWRGAAAMAGVLALTVGCTGTPSGGLGAVAPTRSPAGLSDEELAQALLPEFDGDEPGVLEDERTVLKASAPPVRGEGDFWRLLDTDVPECRRAVAWLRGTAFEAAKADPQARIAAATYVAHPVLLWEELVVARPVMLREVQRDRVGACRSFAFEGSSGPGRATLETLDGAAKIGDWSQAYVIRPEHGEDWRKNSGPGNLWVKVVRFGAFMLEIKLMANPQPKDPVTLELLDETAADALEHASQALADAST